MSESVEHRFIRLISGTETGVKASVARAALRAVEPLYAGLVALRNRAFDWGIRPMERLPRPVISVGNLTTGGTGKTPVVLWLARKLLTTNRRPAILTRGYRKSVAAESDEVAMLRDELGDEVTVSIDTDRAAGGRRAMREREGAIDAFILDDGFQHRRLHRDFDLVLLDATNPFGFGHVLPRGLLREPIGGLARASGALITRVDLVDASTVEAIVDRIRSIAPNIPVFRASHAITGVEQVAGESSGESPALAVSGIANPEAFEVMLERAGITVAGRLRFADHHAFTRDDVNRIVGTAAGAGRVIVTSKDWVKLRRFVGEVTIPFFVARLQLDFAGDDEANLFDLVQGTIRAVV